MTDNPAEIWGAVRDRVSTSVRALLLITYAQHWDKKMEEFQQKFVLPPPKEEKIETAVQSGKNGEHPLETLLKELFTEFK